MVWRLKTNKFVYVRELSAGTWKLVVGTDWVWFFFFFFFFGLLSNKGTFFIFYILIFYKIK